MFSELEYWLSLLFLLALGVLGASSVIVKKKPEARELIEKLAKISGWVGVISALYGIWGVINVLRFVGMLRFLALMWLTMLVTSLVFIGLGFIFGYGMVTAYLSEEAKAKGEQLRKKLVGFQIPLGYVSLVLAVWWLLLRFVIY
ncbi:MAG TPA: hypothetical protein VM425_19420 [Myxococcota bacterium]|nr:hypothetical protein [Myxococcota bacterium]